MTSAIAYPVTIQPDDKGYRAPAKGTTIFPFRFTLPEDIGSSFEVGSEVRTRYSLTGYARVRLIGSFETIINSVEVSSLIIKLMQVDVVMKLPYNHIYRNPEYKFEELKVKDSTDKSKIAFNVTDEGFRGKILSVEASIPKDWWKSGEKVPITLVLTPTGYKKVSHYTEVLT